MQASIQELKQLLCPQGIEMYTNQTSVQGLFLNKHYGSQKQAEILSLHHQRIQELQQAKVCLIGYPCDNGAGLERGSKFGPMHLRLTLHEKNSHLIEDWRREQIVDIGDIYDHPLLSHDSLHSKETLERVHQHRYSSSYVHPVSPLSCLERVCALVKMVNPEIRPVILGGDHSLSLMPVRSLAKLSSFAILHFDAHTDLLSTRGGLPYSYATWAWHAKQLLPSKAHLIQVGIRQTLQDKTAWEQQEGVKQIWANEIEKMSPENLYEAIESHLASINCHQLYISVDIDALSSDFASATGTPSSQGLQPDLLIQVLAKLRKSKKIIGADLVEVAPSLSHGQTEEPKRTLDHATEILKQLLL